MLGRVTHLPRSKCIAVTSAASLSIGRAAAHSRSAATATALAATPAFRNQTSREEQAHPKANNTVPHPSRLETTPKKQALPLNASSRKEETDYETGDGGGEGVPLPELGFPISDMMSLVNQFSLDSQYLQRASSSKVISALRSDASRVIQATEYLASLKRPYRVLKLLRLLHALQVDLPKSVYHAAAHQFSLQRRWHMIPPLVLLEKEQLGRVTTRMLNWRIRALSELEEFAQLAHALDDFAAKGAQPTRRTYHMLASAHLRNYNPQAAQEVLGLMEEAGYPIDYSTDIWIANAYRAMGSDKKISERAIGALASATRRSATIVMNALIRAALDQEDHVRAFRVLDTFNKIGPGLRDSPTTPGQVPSLELLKASSPLSSSSTTRSSILHGIPPSSLPSVADVATFTMLIDYAARRANLTQAKALYQQMVDLGISPDTRAVAALLRAHSAVGDLVSGVALVDSLAQSEAVTQHLSALTRPLKPVLSDPHLSLSAPGLEPDIWLLNALLQCSLNQRGINALIPVLRAMRACEVEPDTSTLTIFLRYLSVAEKARPRELIRTCRTILRSGLRPTQQQYNIIFGSILRESRKLIWGRGWTTLAAIHSPTRRRWYRERSPIMDRLPWVADQREGLAEPTGGVSLPQKLQYQALAEPLLRMLRDRGVRADGVTAGMRLKHQAVIAADPDGAWSALTQMLEANWRPQARHFATLMEGYALLGKMNHAVKVMRAAERAGVRPNVVTYTILIAGYARAGKPEYALRAFDAMLAARIRPDVAVIDALCSAYFAVGAHIVARRLLLELWPQVKSFPEALRHAPLRDLAVEFRAHPRGFTTSVDLLDPKTTTFVPKQPLSKQKARLLRWKVRRIVRVWLTQGTQDDQES